MVDRSAHLEFQRSSKSILHWKPNLYKGISDYWPGSRLRNRRIHMVRNSQQIAIYLELNWPSLLRSVVTLTPTLIRLRTPFSRMAEKSPQHLDRHCGADLPLRCFGARSSCFPSAEFAVFASRQPLRFRAYGASTPSLIQRKCVVLFACQTG